MPDLEVILNFTSWKTQMVLTVAWLLPPLRAEIGDDGVNRFNNSVRYLGVIFEDTISIFVPAIVQALDYLLPVSIKKCKAEHFYDQVNNAITTIENSVKKEKDREELTWRTYLNFQMNNI